MFPRDNEAAWINGMHLRGKSRDREELTFKTFNSMVLGKKRKEKKKGKNIEKYFKKNHVEINDGCSRNFGVNYSSKNYYTR